ncbi:zinc ribbon domain-containing protein [Actinomycetospora endophytica]|uniref:Zinc ribbon domain-containing protein n=1 Tax=Actinomycetospora endophytica TaxID=2291215 RepID=A0ABS8P7Y1_9PSEU|nr:zinc ribbon domain-containing protein [Actinomycetospora endophytica]MCD2193511.1 zinc ribbon domain-containing protein [Actinomycetospora endophytica]
MGSIGTIDATFLAPGISHNNREYTPDLIGKAGQRLIERLADPGGLPVTVLTHHGAGDDSAQIAGRIATAALDENGVLSGSVILADTVAGRDMLALTTPDESGRRFLDSMSIRGYWLGDVRTEDREGRTVMTGDDLEIDGVDFTATPGVDAARLAQARRDAEEARGTGRTPLYESIGHAVVHEASDPQKPHGDVTYADPGYQDDGKKRYPLDTKGHTRSAWAYVSMPKNAAKYSSSQLSSVKSKIKAAAKKFGIKLASETKLAEACGQLDELTEAYMAISAMNGPADVNVSAYGIDNLDLTAVAAKLGQATSAALLTLDPDQDNDIDLDDAEGEVDDTEPADDDAVTSICADCGAEIPNDAKFCPSCGAQITDDSDTESARKGPDVAETDSSSDGGTTFSMDDITKLANALAKAIKGDTSDDADSGSEDSQESADKGTPATEAKTETGETDYAALVAAEVAKAKEAMAKEFAPVMAKALAEQRDAIRDELVSSGGSPNRAGMIESLRKEGGMGDQTPIHQLPAQEQDKRRAELWATALDLGGVQRI